jgi:hypothetical protein
VFVELVPTLLDPATGTSSSDSSSSESLSESSRSNIWSSSGGVTTGPASVAGAFPLPAVVADMVNTFLTTNGSQSVTTVPLGVLSSCSPTGPG